MYTEKANLLILLILLVLARFELKNDLQVSSQHINSKTNVKLTTTNVYITVTTVQD